MVLMPAMNPWRAMRREEADPRSLSTPYHPHDGDWRAVVRDARAHRVPVKALACHHPLKFPPLQGVTSNEQDGPRDLMAQGAPLPNHLAGPSPRGRRLRLCGCADAILAMCQLRNALRQRGLCAPCEGG